MHNKYDLYVSLGKGCPTAQILRALNLQFWSFPFDWVYGSDMVNRAKIIYNNFEKFLDYEYYEYSHSLKTDDCYCNLQKICFPHEFPKGKPLRSSFVNFKNKYARRIKRFINLIENSKRVCFLYIWTKYDYKLYSEEDLIETQKIIQNRFPNVIIDLIYFEINENSLKNKKISKINKNIVKYSFDYSVPNAEFSWIIKKDEIIQCLKGYSISLRHLTFMNILQKYKIYKFNYDRYKKIKSTIFLLKNAVNIV